MPVIETDFATATPRDKELLESLVKELLAPRASGQPVVEIRQMSRGGLRHIHVIWDSWDDVPPERRASIIREAFTEVKGAEYEKSIAITIAATVPEAVDAGLLPFGVKPFGWHGLDKDARSRVRQALLDEGGSELTPGWVPDLRFAGMDAAREAVQRLKHAAPDFDWNVVLTRDLEG